MWQLLICYVYLRVEWAAGYYRLLTYDKTYKKFDVQYFLVQSSIIMDDRVSGTHCGNGGVTIHRSNDRNDTALKHYFT